MAANDTVQFSVEGLVGGQTHVHTLAFRHTSAISSPEQALIDAWQAGCRTEYRNLFVPADTPVITIRAAHVCGAVPLRAMVEETEPLATGVGTNARAGDRLPSWMAAVASVRTAAAGRSRRGRFYIGGLFEADSLFNDLVAGYVGAVQIYANKLLTIFGPAGTDPDYKLVVHSRKLAAVPGTQCQDSSTPVTGIIARTPIGSMKSRKPGSGL